MAELLPQERLQPSLLDRLIDDEPQNRTEGAERRVLNKQQLRQAVLRDLQWLLNSVCKGEGEIAGYPQVRQSVVNYGLPAFTGNTATQISHKTVEAAIKDAIALFEPRIDAKTLDVKIVMTTAFLDTHNTLQIQIRGSLWAQPTPLELLLRTSLDLETGQVAVTEGSIRTNGR
jgi:type VI secretion system protein ImpF